MRKVSAEQTVIEWLEDGMEMATALFRRKPGDEVTGCPNFGTKREYCSSGKGIQIDDAQLASNLDLTLGS